MGKRLECTYYADEGTKTYTLSFYDENYSGAVIDFKPDAEGAVLTYQGEKDKLFVPVLTSKLTVNIYIDSTDIQSFIDDLNTAYEGQFRCKLTSGSTGIWYGFVLYDSITIEDLPITDKPVFKITASDGIKRLKNIPYKDTGGPYEGAESITQHLVNCIGFMGMTDLMTEHSYVLKSVTNWRPSNRISGDDMDHTSFEHRALYSYDTAGNIKYPSVYRVIEQLCYRFRAQFKMMSGAYWFFQPNEYESNNISPDEYTAAKTALGSTVVNSYVTVAATFPGKFGQGFYTYFQPLRAAQVNYLHFGYINLARGFIWNESDQPTIPEPPTVYRVADNTSFVFTSDLRFTLTYSGLRPYYIKFNINLKVGANYLKRPASALSPPYFGEQSIEGTASNYELVFPINLVDSYSYGEGHETINIPSIVFPTGGEVLFTISLNGFYDQQGNAVASVSPFWTFSNCSLVPIKDGDNSNYSNTRRYTGYNSVIGNSETEVINCLIGEDFGFGQLRIEDGGDGQTGNDWGVGSSSAGQTIEELLAKEFIRAQSVPVTRMKMNYLSHDFDLIKSIHHTPSGGSLAKYVFHKGTWRTRYGIFSGDWYKLDLTGTTANDTTEDWVLDSVDSDGNPVNPSNPIGGGDGGPPVVTDDDSSDPVIIVIYAALDALFPVTTADIADATTITQIPITEREADGEYDVGQTVTIIGRGTGAKQDFVISQESATGDTVLYVESTLTTFDFATGSWVVTSQEQQLSAANQKFRQKFTAHTSATLTITENGGTLPTDESKISVYYHGGQWLAPDYWSVSGSDITLIFTPTAKGDIYVEFIL